MMVVNKDPQNCWMILGVVQTGEDTESCCKMCHVGCHRRVQER